MLNDRFVELFSGFAYLIGPISQRSQASVDLLVSAVNFRGTAMFSTLHRQKRGSLQDYRHYFDDIILNLLQSRIIYDGKPVCDESNNLRESLQANHISVDIFIRTVISPLTYQFRFQTLNTKELDQLYFDWSNADKVGDIIAH